MSTGRYTLIGQTPVPEPDLLTWATWFEEGENRIVKQEFVGNIWVSTCFLGLDHNHLRLITGQGDPLLFETMAFYDDTTLEQERCSTWLQAEAQHRSVCALAGAPAYQWRAMSDATTEALRDFWRNLRDPRMWFKNRWERLHIVTQDMAKVIRKS